MIVRLHFYRPEQDNIANPVYLWELFEVFLEYLRQAEKQLNRPAMDVPPGLFPVLALLVRLE